MTTDSLLGTGTGPGLAAFSGAFTCAALFMPLSYVWVTGYKMWVPAGGDTTEVYKFCLYQLTDTSQGVSNLIVPGSTVSSTPPFTAGAWNNVNLPTPIALPPNLTHSTPGPAYAVCAGWTAVSGFPDTDNFWPAAGLTSPNGLLFAFSDQSGTAAEPFTTNYHQGLFGTSSADPTAGMPVTGNVTTNFGVDLNVTTVAPSGASYRALPSFPYLVNWAPDTANNFTLGLEMALSQSCTLNDLWFYSPAGVTQLPTACGVFNTPAGTLVAGSVNSSPSWSGAAGSGWVSVSYGALTLPAGSYRPAVVNGAGTPAIWNAQAANVWAAPGFGANGLGPFGPVRVPSNATAHTPGQASFNAGAALTYPGTNVGPYNYGIDMQVTPLAAPGGGPGIGTGRGNALPSVTISGTALPSAQSSATATG